MSQRHKKRKFREVRNLAAQDRIVVVRPFTLEVVKLRDDAKSAIVRIVSTPLRDMGNGEYLVQFSSAQARTAFLGNPNELERLQRQISELTRALGSGEVETDRTEHLEEGA